MKTFGKYILDKDGNPVAEHDLLKWAQWIETAERHVDDTYVPTLDGEIRVSTVFLGLDHNFSGVGEPILYETMVFGGPLHNEMIRSHDRKEARIAHEKMLRKVKEVSNGIQN